MTARCQHPYEHHLSVATDTFKQLNHVLSIPKKKRKKKESIMHKISMFFSLITQINKNKKQGKQHVVNLVGLEN